MSYETMTGRVSHGHERVTVGGGKKAVYSRVTTTFRLNGQAVEMEGPADIADGDDVTIVGVRKKAVFEAYILRNENTGAVYNEPGFSAWAMIAIGYLASLLLMVIIVGFVFFAFISWFAYKLYRVQKASAILRRMPPRSAAPSFEAARQPLGEAA